MSLSRAVFVSTALCTSLAVSTAPAFAQTEAVFSKIADARVLDTLTVIGRAEGRENIGGSIDFLDSDALDAQGHSDILRVIRVVPGVNIQEEEGYGLRPNIGLRGSGSDRNSRIMIMEDGVPIAPAVYASPSAYYFPSMARINAIEVTKGPAVIQYGPRTTGGAIHLLSTPIPEARQGYAEAMFGDYGRQRLHAWFGDRQALTETLDFGVLIETYQDQADGFLERDTHGPDTGFDVSDYVLKAALSNDGATMPWELELKYQTKDEVSNQTYLGLTRDDFEAAPLRLYDAARDDQMVNDNELFQLTGTIDLTADTVLSVIAYQNEVSRNWYKLHGVNASGGGASGDVALSAIVADPATFSAEYDLLRGVTSLDDSIVLRANNRAYFSRGLATTLDTKRVIGGLVHTINLGLRYHEDEEDRFQHEDAYRLASGELFLTSVGAPGSNANRVTGAEAFSFYVQDRIELTDRLQVAGGLRYEDYEVTRTDYAGDDPTRSNVPDNLRRNSDDVLLPSISAVYRMSETVDLIGGVHKGFAPAGPSQADNEESWQYEAGLRYGAGDMTFDAVVFYNDYQNLLGECTASSGGGCEPGDTFNGDAVQVHGLEVSGAWDAGATLGLKDLSLRLSFAYTYTEGEFQTSFESDFFGDVTAGDALIYVPEHQLTIAAGLNGAKWGTDLLVNYVSEARSEVGQGNIPDEASIDARTLVDMSAWYEITNNVRLKVKAENLFDATYLASLRPSGARPGKPQEILFGVDVSF